MKEKILILQNGEPINLQVKQHQFWKPQKNMKNKNKIQLELAIVFDIIKLNYLRFFMTKIKLILSSEKGSTNVNQTRI